ncbi:hypothetical protein Tco_0752774 [Tanacetum coccineum]|uniref:Uncharacterized protein n=1 Tax=Tanacetum coccineum TaxID=301880 RepID=A0ABQ4Z7T1_9ASTR
MDSNPSQPLVSTHVYTRMHKEDQRETSGPTSLGSPVKEEPTLSSIVVCTDPHVLADQTKSVSEGFETVLTQPMTGKRASSIAKQVEEKEASSTIKLEDLAKLVSNVQPSFKDLDSPEDDPVIVVDDSNEDEEDEVLILQFQKHKLELEKHKAEAEAALLKAQPSFPNVGHLNKLLDLPSKFNKLTEEVKRLKKQVHELEIELPGDLKEISSKLEDFTKTITIANALNHFAQAIASKKTGDTSVLSVGHAGTQPAEEEKNTNQATISHPPKSSSQPEGDHIKKDKGKKAMSLEKYKKESTNIDSNDDDETYLKEDAKAEAAKQEGEVRKVELVDLLGPEVDPLDKLNDLENKKIKHADDVHDYFKANKRLKSSVQSERFLEYHAIYYTRNLLQTSSRCWLDYHARTFNSLLFAEVDKRNLNPLKQIRTIEQLRQ